MKLVALLFLPTIAACSYPIPATDPTFKLDYQVHVSPDFTADDTQVVLAAIAQWPAAVPELTLHVTITKDCAPEAICIYPRLGDPSSILGVTNQVISGPDEGGYFCAMLTESDHAFADAAGQYDQVLQWSTAHEVGHALMGPMHLGNNTLMSWGYAEASMSITPVDVAHFWSVR